MPDFKINTTDEIDAAYNTLQATFRAGTTRPLAWRKHQLNQLVLMLRENIESIVQGFSVDLRKPAAEVLTGEIGPVVPEWQRTWSPTILKRPKGVVLVISPWNYPIFLSLQPIIGAISAGCPAVLKPSEIGPGVSSVLADLFPKYLDPSAYRISQWAAAEHLTPLTLELGGKSPVIIDANTTDLKIAAKRVLWGKTLNAGQICVAPDYALILRSAQDAFVEAIKEAAVELRLDGALASDSVVVGGSTDDEKRRITPTVYRDVKEGDSLLEGEIFGPLLPIVPVDDIRQAIEYINAHPHPLVLYAFTEDAELKQALRDETKSGGLHFNDVIQHMSIDTLPFSGVGESGYGSQALKYTYDEYTQLRSSVDIPLASGIDRDEPRFSARYPPYTPATTRVMAVRAGAIEAPAAAL
ncbi:aldehyde dehydrogenase [Lactarius deliciosus]|nr:aldehyde dehydrogenase [Lactarius deliciosus]